MTLVLKWIHFVMSKCGDGFFIDLMLKSKSFNFEKQIIQFKGLHGGKH